MFRGRFEHSLDDKGRVAIPVRFREELAGEGNTTVVMTNFDRCLAVYSLSEWERLETKISTLPQFDQKVVAFLRYFVSGATECNIDKGGRILIPGPLRQFAKIDHDCVVAGQLNKFEIWSTPIWNDMFGQLSDQFVTITDNMAQHGIVL